MWCFKINQTFQNFKNCIKSHCHEFCLNQLMLFLFWADSTNYGLVNVLINGSFACSSSQLIQLLKAVVQVSLYNSMYECKR